MKASGLLTLVGELIAFVVVIAVIYRYVNPPLRKAMAQRQGVIRAEFDEAREAKEAAEAAEARFRSSISDVEAEVAEIRDSAERLAQQIVEDLKVKAREEADRIGQRAQQQLAADREAMIRGIRAETSTLVVDLAGRLVVEALSDEARRAATIDRFLAGLDDLADAIPAPAGPAEAGRP
ncbi:MAG: F0F1 ATP synthase subunit B [Pseudonocardiales bacterium]